MLLWIRCPSCSTVFSEFDKYVNELEILFNDRNIKPEDKELMRGELMDKYGYVNICCRIRVIGYVPFHKIIT